MSALFISGCRGACNTTASGGDVWGSRLPLRVDVFIEWGRRFRAEQARSHLRYVAAMSIWLDEPAVDRLRHQPIVAELEAAAPWAGLGVRADQVMIHELDDVLVLAIDVDDPARHTGEVLCWSDAKNRPREDLGQPTTVERLRPV